MAPGTVKISRISSPALGVAASQTGDLIVVTTRAGGIAEYSAATQEKKASWRLEAADRDLLGPAQCLVDNTTIAAVKSPENSTQVLSWSPTENSPVRALKRLSVVGAVHSLHPVWGQSSESAQQVQGSAEAFVVFADGTAALLSQCRQGQALPAAATRHTVAAACSCRDKLAVVTVAGASETMLTIHVAEASTIRQEDSIAVSPPSRAALAGLAVRHGKLGLLWDEGSVDVFSRGPNQSYGLKFRRRLSGFSEGKQQSDLNAVNGSSASRSRKRKTTALGEGTLHPECAIAFTAKGSLVCVCWTKDTAEGTAADDAKRLRLTLLDSEYGTVLRNDFIPTEDIGAYQEGSVVQAMLLPSGSIAVLAAEHLIAIKLEESVPTLATLAGSLSGSSRSKQARLNEAALHPREWAALQQPLQPMVVPTWAKVSDAPSAKESGSLEVARPVELGADVGESRQVVEERKELSRIQARIRDAASHDSEPSAAKLVASFLSLGRAMQASELGTCMPEQLVAQMMLAMAQQGFWQLYDKVVDENPLRSLTAAPGLVLLLLQKSQHCRLSTLLQQISRCHVDDLREGVGHITSCAASAADLSWHSELRDAAVGAADLAAAEPSSSSIQDAADAASLVHCFDTEASMLHTFVAASVARRHLMQLMRSLSPSSATWLFRYLQRWLSNILDLGATLSGRVYDSGAVIPPLRRIVDWLAALIDTHLVTIAMSPASVKLAMTSQALTEELLVGHQRLPMMLGALQNVRKKAPLPTCGAAEAPYSIEIMDISIA